MKTTGKFPGWRTMTKAQRYNAKLEAIFDEARRLGAFDTQREQPTEDDNKIDGT